MPRRVSNLIRSALFTRVELLEFPATDHIYLQRWIWPGCNFCPENPAR